jgi:hypothetical protein
VKRKPSLAALVLALLVLGVAALLAACAGGGNVTETTLPLVTTETTFLSTSASLAGGTGGAAAQSDALSTFNSKDPFIPQALPVSTTVSTPPTSNNTSTTYYTTTSYYNTTSTSHTTTTAHATTTTTVAHLHTLKILSISTVSGTPVVTFKVDSTTYKDKRTGDVVSTTWGQVAVVEITTSSKVVTLLHGSETLILGVGQSTFE